MWVLIVKAAVGGYAMSAYSFAMCVQQYRFNPVDGAEAVVCRSMTGDEIDLLRAPIEASVRPPLVCTTE
jgi:hypothetical protein